MRAHIIRDGIVTNTIEVDNLDFMSGLISGEGGGKIGDLWDGQSFSTPVEPLEDIAMAKLLAIQAEKVRKVDGGVTVEGVLFDTDERAVTAYIETMVFLFSQNTSATIENWKASAGVWVTMTLPLLSQVIAAGAGNKTAAFSWQASTEAAIKTAYSNNDRPTLMAISTTYP